MVVYQKSEALNQTHCNDHLQAKMIGRKDMLWNTPWPPVPLRWIKRCWRGRKDGEFWFYFFFNFVLWRNIARVKSGWGGLGNEWNWSEEYEIPKVSIKFMLEKVRKYFVRKNIWHAIKWLQPSNHKAISKKSIVPTINKVISYLYIFSGEIFNHLAYFSLYCFTI